MAVPKIDAELRSTLRHTWISLLYEFASPPLQRVWVTGHDEEIHTFTELICMYFDDLDLGEGLERAVSKGLLTDAESRATLVFHELANAYQEPPGGDAEVLSDPAWSEVVLAAQEMWPDLRQLIEEPTERELMAELEQRWGEVDRGPS